MAATPANVTVQLSPASILANGSSTSAVTGTVTDAGGAGMSGETVWLSAPSDSGIKFSPNPATTGPSGGYTSTLTSSLTAGGVVVLAADGLAAVHPALLTLLAASTTSLIEVTGSSPPVTNQGVTLVAAVTSMSGNVAPSGTVTFENGGAPIGGCEAVPVPTEPSAIR